MDTRSIGIIGYGKFGQLMAEIFAQTLPDTTVKISSRSQAPDGERFFSFSETCKSDIVIPAVPISAFADTIAAITPELRGKRGEGQTVIDVCSVKSWPKQVMLTQLPEAVDIICTHPNFGPESYRLNDYKTDGLNFIIENVRCSEAVYNAVLNYLNSLSFNVIEMSAAQHDEKVGVPHFLAMVFGLTITDLELQRIEIGAASTQRMFDMAEGVGKDMGIVHDMYKYNPFCKPELERLRTSFTKITRRIAAD